MEAPILRHLFDGILLVGATVTIHSAGTLLLLWSMVKVRSRALEHFGFLPNTLRLTVVVLALLMLHLMEVALWAAFYNFRGCFRDWPTSIYFSIVTYTTVGYGDVLLDKQWRLLGGVEALTGILMASWSTALLLSVVNWIYTHTRNRWGVQAMDA